MIFYDKTKIGKKIASGGDRKVYKYDTDKVIKFSTLSFLSGKKLHSKYCQDYLVCKKYFGDYILETKDVSDIQTSEHIEIQPFINGEWLNEKHTKNPEVKSQLKEIVRSMKIMKEDGSPIIDLVGNIGMMKPCLSNIFVNKQNKLIIIDAILIEGKTVMPLGIILEMFAPIIIARQNYLLNKFLK